MSGINDGGPAYPVAESHDIAADIPWTGGLTIRDYFAARAMSAFIAKGTGFTPRDPTEDVCQWSYDLADAMIAQRDVVNADYRKI